MNYWTEKSIELANQRNYLDLLYKIYPMSHNLRREITAEVEEKLVKYHSERKKKKLLNLLLDQEVFPIKDSYIAYLKRDRTAIERNPKTVNRITSILYEMGISEIIEKITVPKETNRQIGPLFKKWISEKYLGCEVTNNIEKFLAKNDDIIFNASDQIMKNFANEYLGYKRDKGVDFIAKFNSKYIMGEAKFLTDFGGHQNAQFDDAMFTLETALEPIDKEVIKIAILDGVLYIPSENKLYKNIINRNDVILSALLLRDFLYSL